MIFTHNQLVKIAYRWVLANASCGVAFRELVSSGTDEIPDVIGFGAWGHSVLVECKVTRSDFLCDRKKSFRVNPTLGMGSQRFYCVPTGLINKEELPEGWGLLYVTDKGKCIAQHNPYRGPFGTTHPGHEKSMRGELGIMYSALRRLHIRGRVEEIYIDLASSLNSKKLENE